MKSLLRWTTTLGLVGSTLLLSWLSQPLKVLALPEADVVKVLEQVPVFAITDKQGSLLVQTGQNNQKITGIFISPSDAQKVFENIKKNQPDLANNLTIQVVPLSEVYKLDNANADKPDRLNFAYVPTQIEVEAAKKLLTTNGEEYKGGVPLYVVRGGKEQGFLTSSLNNEQIIPFFFDKKEVQGSIDQLKKDNPELGSTVKIEVVPLEILMATLKQKDDEMFKKIRIFPSLEAIEFIQKNNSTQPQSQPSQPPK